MTTPIEDNAMTGDCKTAALVGRDARLMHFLSPHQEPATILQSKAVSSLSSRALMGRKYVVSALVAPFLVCLVLVPLLLTTAQRDVAAGINGQTLKAADQLKRPELKWASLGLFHASLKKGE